MVSVVTSPGLELAELRLALTGLTWGDADQLMNLHLASENIALSVAYLRNSRAITCNIRLDGKIFSHNLLRPELISIPPCSESLMLT